MSLCSDEFRRDIAGLICETALGDSQQHILGYRKMKIQTSLVVLGFSFVVAAARGQSDVDIHASAKMLSQSQPLSQGHHQAAKENWTYEIMLENRRFQPLTQLQARYMVFYTTAELGSKEAPLQQHQNGSFSIDVLQPQEKKQFTTTPIDLNKSHLVGRRHYVNGGRMKAEDALVGVWVRVYQGERIIGEYANPSTLMKEQWQ